MILINEAFIYNNCFIISFIWIKLALSLNFSDFTLWKQEKTILTLIIAVFWHFMYWFVSSMSFLHYYHFTRSVNLNSEVQKYIKLFWIYVSLYEILYKWSIIGYLKVSKSERIKRAMRWIHRKLLKLYLLICIIQTVQTLIEQEKKQLRIVPLQFFRIHLYILFETCK